MHGRKTHDLVQKGLTALCNLEHRGAAGAEQNTGDGAGILVQMPDAFFRAALKTEANAELPAEGANATGMAFIAADNEDQARKIQ